METRSKKQASDYPQMLIRVSQEDKEVIESQIETLLVFLNSQLDPSVKKIKKTSIAVDALKRGLKEMMKENDLI
jgi:hypothetical protein